MRIISNSIDEQEIEPKRLQWPFKNNRLNHLHLSQYYPNYGQSRSVKTIPQTDQLMPFRSSTLSRLLKRINWQIGLIVSPPIKRTVTFTAGCCPSLWATVHTGWRPATSAERRSSFWDGIQQNRNAHTSTSLHASPHEDALPDHCCR